MTSRTPLAIGTLVKTLNTIGPWPIGSLAKVIPAPGRVINYDDVNSTGERKEFTGNAMVWLIMRNPDKLDAIGKFAVELNEIETVGK